MKSRHSVGMDTETLNQLPAAWACLDHCRPSLRDSTAHPVPGQEPGFIRAGQEFVAVWRGVCGGMTLFEALPELQLANVELP